MGALPQADAKSGVTSPVAVENADGAGDFVIVCDHASNDLPAELGSLGLRPEELQAHIAWDPGALSVSRGLAARLDSALVYSTVSRLAIDCNRRLAAPDLIAARSETTLIPGNASIAEPERRRRIAAFHAPYHAAIKQLIDRRLAAGLSSALVAVHSFTPVYRGARRPWHVGIVSTRERRLADAMLAALRREPGLVVGDNEPYSPKDNVDYTIRRHGRDRGLPHVMIEIRNDLLRAAKGVAEWVERLTDALRLSAASGALVPVRAERPRQGVAAGLEFDRHGGGS